MVARLDSTPLPEATAPTASHQERKALNPARSSSDWKDRGASSGMVKHPGRHARWGRIDGVMAESAADSTCPVRLSSLRLGGPRSWWEEATKWALSNQDGATRRGVRQRIEPVRWHEASRAVTSLSLRRDNGRFRQDPHPGVARRSAGRRARWRDAADSRLRLSRTAMRLGGWRLCVTNITRHASIPAQSRTAARCRRARW
jgi:hypothetical protein